MFMMVKIKNSEAGCKGLHGSNMLIRDFLTSVSNIWNYRCTSYLHKRIRVENENTSSGAELVQT